LSLDTGNYFVDVEGGSSRAYIAWRMKY